VAQKDHAHHIDNLDAAIGVIAQIGTLYNGLERSEKKQLLRQVIERVVVNPKGVVRLELRAPFAYLHPLHQTMEKPSGQGNTPKRKTSRSIASTRLLAPQAGFEPATDRLTADCSAVELLWNDSSNHTAACAGVKPRTPTPPSVPASAPRGCTPAPSRCGAPGSAP
jgi:hypothetical protein